MQRRVTREPAVTLDGLKATWEGLGRTDPLWAVLTDPDRRNGGWTVEEFLATGVGPVRRVRQLLDEAGLRLGDRVLDFGCGAGRLSNALADHAGEVVGIDIARSMIEEAERINRRPDQVQFVHYDGTRLPFADESFDSAVSLISIQHSPPAVQVACLVELQRVVRPGGALVLQIPSRPVRPLVLPPAAMRARIDVVQAPRQLGAGQLAAVTVRVTNVSDNLWPAGQLIRLGNHWYASDADGNEVLSWNDGRADLPHDLPAGAAVELQLPVTAPRTGGELVLELDLVQEAVTWWAEVGSEPTRTTVTVTEEPVPDVAAPEPPELEARPAARGRADGGMQMFGMDVNLVRLLFTHCDCRVVSIVPDDQSGPEWESFTYVIQRGRTG
jgi:SAM-dependent methyltransferase